MRPSPHGPVYVLATRDCGVVPIELIDRDVFALPI
jgi:hypothetical protein